MPSFGDGVAVVASAMATGSAPGSLRPVAPVAILAERLDRLVEELGSAGEVDDAWRAELESVRDLAAGLDPYLERWSTPESAALRLLTARTRSHDWGVGPLEHEMLSGHVEGQLLKMLVHATRARRVLEIGMFTGYSALAMAEALPAHGRIVACEIDAAVAEFAQASFDLSPDGHKIDVRVGPASRTLQKLALADVQFDLVFIDADKAGYTSYLNAVLDTDLLDAQGLICVDNTLLQGQPWMPRESTENGVAIAAFNQAVAADPRIEQVIVPLRDGVTLIRRVDPDAAA